MNFDADDHDDLDEDEHDKGCMMMMLQQQDGRPSSKLLLATAAWIGGDCAAGLMNHPVWENV